MKVIVEYNSFDDLYKNCWCGALDTLDRIAELDKEEELMSFFGMYFEEMPTDTQINDLLWFDDEFIFEELGISWEDEEEDDEDENN